MSLSSPAWASGLVAILLTSLLGGPTNFLGASPAIFAAGNAHAAVPVSALVPLPPIPVEPTRTTGPPSSTSPPPESPTESARMQAAPAPSSATASSMDFKPAKRAGLVGLATLLVAFASVFAVSSARAGARGRIGSFRGRR